MGKVLITLTKSTATEEAARLIREGGECNSWEVLCQIRRLLGDYTGSYTQDRLFFYRDSPKPFEFGYEEFSCAIREGIEIRP